MTPAATAAIDLIIGVEGAPSNDPNDSGGYTRFGHDQASWPDTLRRCPAGVAAQLPVMVRDLTREQAVLAYEYGYIIFFHCDQMPAPLMLIFFDALVNQGQGWAPSAFQSSVGAGPDGTIGKATVAASNRCDLQTAVADFAHARDDRYRAIPQFSLYGKGWLRRLFHVLLVCMTYDAVPATVPAHVGTPYKGPPSAA
jgi:lysozyme family protein